MVEDAAKKRREYLWKTIRAYGVAALAASVGLACIAVLCKPVKIYRCGTQAYMFPPNAILLQRYVDDIQFSVGSPCWLDELKEPVLALVPLVALISCSFSVCHGNVRAIKRIEYVPPVAEQLAALPAADVLLRGSDQPAAAPDELLRPAHEGMETDAEELLRAGQGADEKPRP